MTAAASLNFQIFWVFFKIGFMSFGGVFGVLPELERMIVTEHHWITHSQFIQSYVISQFLPGPNMVMCPLIGYWVNGIGGLVAGFVGIYLAPLIVMGVSYFFYSRYRNLIWVRKIEISLRPLVFGLLISSVLRFWWLQSPGLKEDLSLYFRIGALFVGALGIWLVQKRKVGPLLSVFFIGTLWWGLNWLVISPKPV